MRKIICKNCHQDTRIKIMVDYSSDYLWCDRCGVMINIEDLSLPVWVQHFIELWGFTWEVMVKDSNFSEKLTKKYYEETGVSIEEALGVCGYESYFFNPVSIEKEREINAVTKGE